MQAWNTNGIDHQKSEPYTCQLYHESFFMHKTHIETISDSIANVAAVPAQTKIYPYTAPAGPPLFVVRDTNTFDTNKILLTFVGAAKMSWNLIISVPCRVLWLRFDLREKTLPGNQYGCAEA